MSAETLTMIAQPTGNPDTVITDAEQIDLSTYNGMLTIQNTATGGHRTFRVKTRNRGKLAGERVVELLTGPNRSDWTNWQSFAFATDHGVKVWRSKQTETGSKWELFGHMLNNPKHWSENRGLNYMLECHCIKCNRRLNNPDSIRRNMGPICAGKA